MSSLPARIPSCPRKSPFPRVRLLCSITPSRTAASSFGPDMDILIDAERIQRRVTELARQIAYDLRECRPVTIVGVLTGSLMFLADLVRHLDLPLRIGWIQASSYRGAVTFPDQLHVAPELLPDLRGRHVLLLDDILDTGRTLSYLLGQVRE